MSCCATLLRELSAATAMLLITFVAHSTSAQCLPPETAKLNALDGDSLDGFAFSVSISEDVAIMGAWVDEELGILSGAAYVFRLIDGQWVQEQKLLASDGAAGDRFGHAVAISGDVAVIGAVLDDDACPSNPDCDSGSAYVFRHDGVEWVEQQKLTAAAAAAIDQFGFTVAVDGGLIVVGAVGDDETEPDSGAAYIYRYDGSRWNQDVKLKAFDAAFFDMYGISVAVSGEVVFVGSRWDDDDGSNSGSVYVYGFRDNQWEHQQKITASDAKIGADFGHHVSLTGDTALIGARWDDPACPGDPTCRSGAAYVFRFNGRIWREEQKLVPSDPAPDDEFGHAVAIEGDVAIVAARFDDEACPENPDCNSGSAYIFTFDGQTWSEEAKLVATDTAATDFYGISVALSGEWALVGSYLDDDLGTASGSAYMYRGLSDCNTNDALDICDIAEGRSLDANGNGVPDECESDCDPCDMNCDGAIDAFDIEPFLDLLFGGGEPCAPCTGDADGNGAVDAFDIEPFLNCLFP